MKIRNDFVTNSSSTSYICAICGKPGISYNEDDPEVVNCSKCKSVFDRCCAGITWDNKTKQQVLRGIIDEELKTKTNTARKKLFKSMLKSLNAGVDLTDKWFDYASDMSEEISTMNEVLCEELHMGSGVPSSMCPICNYEVIRDKDLIEYLFAGRSRKEIEEEIRSANRDITTSKGVAE